MRRGEGGFEVAAAADLLRQRERALARLGLVAQPVQQQEGVADPSLGHERLRLCHLCAAGHLRGVAVRAKRLEAPLRRVVVAGGKLLPGQAVERLPAALLRAGTVAERGVERGGGAEFPAFEERVRLREAEAVFKGRLFFAVREARDQPFRFGCVALFQSGLDPAGETFFRGRGQGEDEGERQRENERRGQDRRKDLFSLIHGAHLNPPAARSPETARAAR